MENNSKSSDIISVPSIQHNVVSCLLSGAVLNLGNAQHEGKRPYQEDSFGFSDIAQEKTGKKGILAVLADGMGGLSNGKQVSTAVVNALIEWFNDDNTVCENSVDVKRAVETINDDIARSYSSDGRVTAGSTLSAVLIRDDEMSWLCVGDSRVYLKRDGKLYRVNEDHDLLNDLLEMYIDGKSELSAAFGNVQKDGLVNCIGKPRITNFDYNKKTFRLYDGDTVVICSDGVYNAFTAEEFNGLIKGSAMECASEIRDTVLSKNFVNQDNLTVLVLSYKQIG